MAKTLADHLRDCKGDSLAAWKAMCPELQDDSLLALVKHYANEDPTKSSGHGPQAFKAAGLDRFKYILECKPFAMAEAVRVCSYFHALGARAPETT